MKGDEDGMVKEYEPLYTVKEAAKILRVNVSAVYRFINSKQLPGLRLGAIKIRGSDLERFIEQYPIIDVALEEKGQQIKYENFESNSMGQAPERVSPGAVEKAGDDPGDKRCQQSGVFWSSGWSADRSDVGSLEGIMDIVKFTNWFIPRMICAGGLLLLAMAVSQIF